MNPITKLINAAPEASLCALFVVVIFLAALATIFYAAGRIHQAITDRRRRAAANNVLRLLTK